MKTRIALIAACVGAFALAQAGLAQAGDVGAPNGAPADPTHPNQMVSTTRSNIKHNEAAPGAPTHFNYVTIDAVHTVQRCMSVGGTVVQHDGKQTCKLTDDANSAMGGVSTTR